MGCRRLPGDDTRLQAEAYIRGVKLIIDLVVVRELSGADTVATGTRRDG